MERWPHGRMDNGTNRWMDKQINELTDGLMD